MGNLFWDWYQDRRIAEGVKETSDARMRADTARELVERLEERVERLMLSNAAMWEILQLRLGVSEADLSAKMAEIDLRDGQSDGRLNSRELSCSKCGRPLSRRHKKCIYCGAGVVA